MINFILQKIFGKKNSPSPLALNRSGFGKNLGRFAGGPSRFRPKTASPRFPSGRTAPVFLKVSAIRAYRAWGITFNVKRSLSDERKFLPTGAIRAEATLQLLRGRGGENPARRPVCGTGWGPASESLRVVSTRPAKGEEIFSRHHD